MMSAEPNLLRQRPNEKYAPALVMLAAVSQMEAEWLETENQAKANQLLSEGLPLFDRVISLFHTLEETTMEAWTMLQKASLLADLAQSGESIRPIQLSYQALQLVRESFNRLGESPETAFSVNTDLYLLILETLLKIHALLADPGQKAALEELIQSLSAHFGECLAKDLSLREQAADQIFTSQVLNSLMDLEEDPHTRQEMLTVSQDLALQAYDRLHASSASDLGPAVSLLAALKNKERQASSTRKTFCPQCSAESPSGAHFCSQCGARLHEEVP